MRKYKFPNKTTFMKPRTRAITMRDNYEKLLKRQRELAR